MIKQKKIKQNNRFTLKSKLFTLAIATLFVAAAMIALPFQTAQGAASDISNIRFVQVVSGAEHSLGLTYDGDVYSWGSNDKGQLGLNDGKGGWSGTPTSTPRLIINSANIGTVINGTPSPGLKVVKVAATNYSSAILLSDGSLYTFGGNDFGERGSRSTQLGNKPTKVDPYSTEYSFVDVVGGANHFIGSAYEITKSNDVVTNAYPVLVGFGRNDRGQISSKSVSGVGAVPLGDLFSSAANSIFVGRNNTFNQIRLFAAGDRSSIASVEGVHVFGGSSADAFKNATGVNTTETTDYTAFSQSLSLVKDGSTVIKTQRPATPLAEYANFYNSAGASATTIRGNLALSFSISASADMATNNFYEKRYMPYTVGNDYSLMVNYVSGGTAKLYGFSNQSGFIPGLNDLDTWKEIGSLPVTGGGSLANSTIEEMQVAKSAVQGQNGLAGAVVSSGKVYVWEKDDTSITDVSSKLMGRADIVRVFQGPSGNTIYNGSEDELNAGSKGTFYALDNRGRLYLLDKSILDSDAEVYPITAAFDIDGTNKNGLTGGGATATNIGFTTSVREARINVNSYGTSDLKPFYISNRGFNVKLMQPKYTAPVAHGSTQYVDEDFTGKLDKSIYSESVKKAIDNGFKVTFYEQKTSGGSFTEVTDEYAARYFGIKYTPNTTIAGNEGREFTIVARARTARQWRVEVWVGAYEQLNTNTNAVDDVYYYDFAPVTFTITGVANTTLVSKAPTSTTKLDANVEASAVKYYSAYDIKSAMTELISYNASRNLNLENLPSDMTSYNKFIPLASDADRETLKFSPDEFDATGALKSHASSAQFYTVKRVVGTASFTTSLTEAELRTRMSEFENSYNIDYTITTTGSTTLNIVYEYLEVAAKETITSNSINFSIYECEIGSDAPLAFTNIMLSFEVSSSATFDVYAAPAAGQSKRNVVIGTTTSAINFMAATKTRGATTNNLLYVGDVATVKIESLFKDASNLMFQPLRPIAGTTDTINYLERLQDPDLYGITLTAETFTIEARAEFKQTFTIRIESRSSSADAIDVNITVESTKSNFPLRKNATLPSIVDINTVTSFMPTQLFQAGDQSATNKSGTDTTISFISVVSSNPDIASARVESASEANRYKKITVSPLTDGTTSLRVTAKFFSETVTVDVNIKVTNCTVYSVVQKFNSLKTISTKELVSAIAFANAPDSAGRRAELIANLTATDSTNNNALWDDFITFEDTGATEATPDSVVVTATHTSAYGGQIRLVAKLTTTVYQTVMNVTFRDKTNGDKYLIRVQIVSTFRQLNDENGERYTFTLGKEAVGLNTSVFAKGIGADPDETVSLDMVLYGDIEDEELSSSARFAAVVDTDSTFTLSPNRNGSQVAYFVVYSASNTLDVDENGQPQRYRLATVVSVSGITTVLTLREYGLAFLIAGASSLGFLFIVFLIRFAIYLRKRSEQKKLIKRNESLIKMRDKVHGNSTSVSREKVVQAKLKMQHDPKYAKMVEDLRKTRGATIAGAPMGEPHTFDMSSATMGATMGSTAVTVEKGGKKSKKKKSDLDQMRADIEERKAKLAQMQDGVINERSAIDEQIIAKMSSTDDDLLDLL